jgi:site-specific DNA-methyltransferase (adenine-specific)
MPVGSAPQIFSDPPYRQGIDYGSHFNDSMPIQEYLNWSRSWLAQARRVLKKDGSLWLLVSHEIAWQLVPIALEVGFHLYQWLTWFEGFGVNCTKKFNRCSRPLLWFVADPKRVVFNADAPEIRRPSDRLLYYNEKPPSEGGRANPDGKILDDVLGIRWKLKDNPSDPNEDNGSIPRVAGKHAERIKDSSGKSIFPTQLPLKLLRIIIAAGSNPGDLIVDPFSGSATTGVAALQLGRRYLGIEKSPTFAALSRERLTAEGESDVGQVG